MYSRYRRRPKWLDILGLQESKTNVIKWQKPGLFILLTLGLATTLYISNSNKLNNVHSLEPRSIGASRRLLETENSTESSGHGPQWEQCDFETGTSSGAWIFNHAMCILFIFVALAIVCDDFFVPSLEAISEKLHLSEDVAGATFMAAGSSAPELFTSVAGVAVQTDVGVGTIVGSAVFNLLIIIALTAALAGQVLHLDWRPMARDSFFYAMSIGCFIGFAWDGYFMHYEAVIFLILYALYIVLMVFNPRVMDWMATWRCCCGQKVEPADGEAGEGEKETNLNSSTTKLQNETDERKFSLTGGHARRLQLISHKGGSIHDMEHEPRQFRHQRGSIAGVLMFAQPPSRHNQVRKDSGFQSRENSTYVHSTDTSRTDLGHTSPDQTYANEESLRPPSTKKRSNEKNGSLPKGGQDEYEMESKVAHDFHETTESSSDDVLLPAITVPKNHPALVKQGSVPKLPPIQVQNSMVGSPTKGAGHFPNLGSPPKLPPIVQETEENDSDVGSAHDHYNSHPNDLDRNPRKHSDAEPNSNKSESAQHPQHPIGRKKSGTPASTFAIHEENEIEMTKKDSGEPRKEDDDDDEEEETMNICPCLPCCCPIRTRPPNSDQAKKEGGCANWSKLIVRWILFFPAFPFVVLFSWTIPDCSKEHNKKYYILSFVMSVVWIAILSFAMVTLVGRTGCILGVDSYVMGLVVVAIGTSIPDALSSVLVARDGYGDMAVSNAIGSNVFDINLGLGLPFIIRIAIDKGAPIVLLQDDEWVDFYTGHMPIMPHAKFGFILLIILAIALVVFGLAKFRLNKYIGVAFVIMYVIFLIYAFMQELYCVRVLELYC